jgi:hypothetical protein
MALDVTCVDCRVVMSCSASHLKVRRVRWAKTPEAPVRGVLSFAGIVVSTIIEDVPFRRKANE